MNTSYTYLTDISGEARMIGYVFNTLETVVIEQFGEDAWDDLLEQAKSDGVYHGLGNYPDADIVALVAAASEKLKLSVPDILRWFGDQAIPKFKLQWPDIFSRFDSLSEYIRSLNDIIHPQVKQLYPGAQVPYFELIEDTSEKTVIKYVSSRQMCHLAEGLIIGSAKEFNTEVKVTQPKCSHNGDDDCIICVEYIK